MLTVDGVYKSYGRNEVLKGISLEARRGEIVGIAGENGSGKSTLLSIMTSILRPDSGTVTLDGQDVFSKGFRRQKISFVPQESTVFDELRVQDNIKFWAAAYKLPYAPKLFGGGDLKKKAAELSGGMRRRLNIELALINSPEFLVMDEPTSALDLVYQRQVMELAAELKAGNTGVVFTSHYADELWNCDRLGIIAGGRFIFLGKPEEFSTKQSFYDKIYAEIKRSI